MPIGIHPSFGQLKLKFECKELPTEAECFVSKKIHKMKLWVRINRNGFRSAETIKLVFHCLASKAKANLA